MMAPGNVVYLARDVVAGDSFFGRGLEMRIERVLPDHHGLVLTAGGATLYVEKDQTSEKPPPPVDPMRALPVEAAIALGYLARHGRAGVAVRRSTAPLSDHLKLVLAARDAGELVRRGYARAIDGLDGLDDVLDVVEITEAGVALVRQIETDMSRSRRTVTAPAAARRRGEIDEDVQ